MIILHHRLDGIIMFLYLKRFTTIYLTSTQFSLLSMLFHVVCLYGITIFTKTPSSIFNRVFNTHLEGSESVKLKISKPGCFFKKSVDFGPDRKILKPKKKRTQRYFSSNSISIVESVSWDIYFRTFVIHLMCNSSFDVPGHIVPDKAIFCNMLGRELVSNSFHRIILSPFTFK